MAGFRMHVGTSTVLGCGYAGALNLAYGVHWDTAIVSGAMCGFSGMLPDLDSDYGVPLRETMAFAAAIVPMMLVPRFQAMQLAHDTMALAAVAMYLFVRFGVTKIIRKYTVHRGMFHSIPAMLIFTGLAFLISGSSPIEVRCYKAGGVMGGFLSHLLLDEIYAVEWKSGRWRLKKSFGTAFKFWGDDAWSNFSTYAKLALVAMMILGEPSVMERLEVRNPQIAGQINEFRGHITALNANARHSGAGVSQGVRDFLNNAAAQFGPAPPTAPAFGAGAQSSEFAGPPQAAGSGPSQWQWPASDPAYSNQNSYDTAQRPMGGSMPQ